MEIARSNDNPDFVIGAAKRWGDAIVEDGSLPDTGYEINTNPTSGDVFIEHVTDICGGLRRAGAIVDTSCGMHCHVGAGDFSYFDLFKLCRLYGAIEDGLFSLVSKSRRNGNRYAERCKSIYNFRHYTTFKRDLIVALYGEDALELHMGWSIKRKKPHTNFHRGKDRLSASTNKYSSARYYALNLHSFYYRQTIEFRHHNGITDATKAANWGMLCASVLDAAQRLTLREIDTLIAQHDSFELLVAILPQQLQAWTRNRRDDLR